jgi:FkbM family methyltransferase
MRAVLRRVGLGRSSEDRPVPGVPPRNAVSGEFAPFLTEQALGMNAARLEHLASLGLDLDGKRVLEVGAGIGLHTSFFEERGCEVLSTDGNPRNVAEMSKRYPRRNVQVLDLDREADLGHLGEFEIVYCYGTLYHLARPAAALRALAGVCSGLLLLETCVALGAHSELHLVREPPDSNMAVSGLGARPTRQWVMDHLREAFGHAYVTKTQPRHPDFEVDWERPAFQLVHRAVFVGSKQPLDNPNILDRLPTHQSHLGVEGDLLRRPRSDVETRLPSRVWLDVGAHLGVATIDAARRDPDLLVYAFEPNLEVAAKTSGALENFVMIPMAVSESDGFAPFHLNRYEGASSLLPFNEGGLREWKDGELFEVERVTMVPTIRLDTFLNWMGIRAVELLKIDTQGADLAVVRSAGERLRGIRTVILEVAVTPTQLYEGAASKEQVVAYMESHGFALTAVEAQHHDQELNLTFQNQR